MFEAKIIRDSICNGFRLTTLELTQPRIIHSEFMTHCMFARNASSSRAIPFHVSSKKVRDDPFIPSYWGKNQPGMSAREEVDEDTKFNAIEVWLHARDQMLLAAESLNNLGIHKQIVNRLLEPFNWITVAVTGDSGAWSNYFAQRCHPDADPSMKQIADLAQLAYFRSNPNKLKPGEWHFPYLSDLEIQTWPPEDAIRVSVGRCARTSYLSQSGVRDRVKDVELHDRLMFSVPKHMSPFEHIAQAHGTDMRFGKYRGWKSYRHAVAGEYITDFKPNLPELTDGKV